MLHEQGRLNSAEHLYRATLQADPADVDALHNLAILCIQQNKYDDAAKLAREALRAKPELALAYHTLGVALISLGQLEEAEFCCRTALRISPEYVEAYNTLGVTLIALGRFQEAERCCREAVRLKADYPEAYNNLGNVLRYLGRVKEAEICFREALRVKPQNPVAYNNLGDILIRQGRLEEASVAFARAASLRPDDVDALATWFQVKQRICDWSDYGETEVKILQGVRRQLLPGMAFNLLGIASKPDQQLSYARQVAAKLAVPRSSVLSSLPPTRGARVRLGYLSCDFRDLPTSYLAVGLIEHHDRRRFEVIGYSAGVDDGGPMRRRIASVFDRFIDISNVPDLEAARLIHSDAIDVLIDLNGYKPENRAKILAYRPAPIQVNYLGYPGTMGADFIDYIIVDRFIVPTDQQPFFSERLVHLPHCYQCNDDKRDIAAATPSRAECGLPEHGFVFCCFNDSYKIGPQFFDIWMRLLLAVPGSVMWLLERDAITKANLVREAGARGTPPERLVFAQRLPLSEHLARHRLADLFLDTLPYNAHTTASDALWAGLPVLTCAGSTFASRVAGSLLKAVGLDELITTSLQEYEGVALRLARDAGLLGRLRARLAENRLNSPLFDSEHSARALEAAYQRMCENRRAGLPPTAFSILASEISDDARHSRKSQE
ncbi:MAG: tetratricopeptide repeat protein [Alphaproteobacteria bacterium]|nr:tetratricopeptide repeat protein [Alphaproteobacteria bacterium]